MIWRDMKSSLSRMKVLLNATSLLILIVMVALLEVDGGTKASALVLINQDIEISLKDDLHGGHIHVGSKVDLNYVSKRKVPNGPDPIHNRRAGNSRRPPGKA